jgi:hypothetical protein
MNLSRLPSGDDGDAAGRAPDERRPRLIVDVDARGPRILDHRGDVAVLYQGHLWRRASRGCAPCMTGDHRSGGGGGLGSTLRRETARGESWVCLEHGPLAKVRYRSSRSYEIRIGPIVRRATDRIDDILLLPASMTRAERRAYLERLLDEVEAEERDRDAIPEDAP